MAEGRRGDPPGIRGLLGLIDKHRGAIEFDFRSRIRVPLTAVPDDVGWDEAVRLVGILRSDPSSAIAAALEGWDFPISREALALYDLFDVTVMANSDTKRGKPKPHGGRPFKIQDRRQQTFGDTGGRTRAEVVEILNALGHSLPV